METMIEKLDLVKMDKAYYNAQLSPKIMDLDAYFYVTIEGQSRPDAPKFLQAIEALYATVYGIKFLSKAEDNDFVVPKMEGQWWVPGEIKSIEDFQKVPKDQWLWKIMIRMPDFIEGDHFHRSIESIKVRKPDLKNIEEVRFELINEGLAAQILHMGSYDDEAATLKKLHNFISSEGAEINGHHHEIYLSDPRRTNPEKLKTIIRYPVTYNV
ncbi:MAG: GyrI-like domain-containing protein [Bacteroidota bacterium]